MIVDDDSSRQPMRPACVRAGVRDREMGIQSERDGRRERGRARFDFFLCVQERKSERARGRAGDEQSSKRRAGRREETDNKREARERETARGSKRNERQESEKEINREREREREREIR